MMHSPVPLFVNDTPPRLSKLDIMVASWEFCMISMEKEQTDLSTALHVSMYNTLPWIVPVAFLALSIRMH